MAPGDDKIEEAIEETLLDSLKKPMTKEEVELLEQRVTTVRKLSRPRQ